MENTATVGMQIAGLSLAIFCLMFLVLRTKVHAFLAMLIAACIAGILGGLTATDTLGAIQSGFGKTLGSIGIVIGLGVMMGRILEVSGAAEQIAFSFIKFLGKKKEEWALAITGYIVSIPIFVDSAFVILYPIAKALAKKSQRSILTLGIALAGGLVVTHHVVPPTPGPLGAAGILGVDIGVMMLAGMLLCIPCMIGIVLYAQWLAKKYPDFGKELLTEDDEFMPKDLKANYDKYMQEKATKQLPSLTASLMPIIIPIILIFIKAVVGIMLKGNPDLLPGLLIEIINFVGSPVVALAISLLIAIYTLSGLLTKDETIDRLEDGIQACGIILLVTGAGGALGEVLRHSGTGDAIAAQVANLSYLPPVMIPFIIATLVRIIQGSGTVSMITAASISAPILAQIPDVNMLTAALAATMGSLFFGCFNDSLFWVVNRMMGVKQAKQQMIVWSVPTTIAWAIGGVSVLILDVIL